MDRRSQGNIGEAKAVLYYTEMGYEVFLPTVNASHVDLIAVKGMETVRVQVKTSSFILPSGSYDINLKTAGGNSSWSGVAKTISKEFVDEVFIWCTNDSTWIVPSSVLDGKSHWTAGHGNVQYHVRGPCPPPPRKSGRKSGSKPKTCSFDDCESVIGSRSQMCRAHANLGRRSVADYPEVETLISMVSSVGFKKVGQTLGVSDNAVRKYIRNRGYDPKTLSLINSLE